MEVVDLLLQLGADVNAVDADGVSVLSAAAGAGQAAVVQQLLGHHADITLANNAGKTALDLAKGGATVQVLERAKEKLYRGRYAIRKADLEVQDPRTRGTTGRVLFAVDRISGSHVAIKLYQDVEGRDRSLMVMGMLDARHMAPLDGPEETCVFDDADNFPDNPYAMVMKRGAATLQELLDSNEWKEEQVHEACRVRGIFESIALAVKHMHLKHLVHGDIKPKNLVMFHDGGRFRLIDFEQAKKVDHEPASTCTTPEICPPELARVIMQKSAGRVPPASRTTDMWALGCVLFHLVNGHSLVSRLVEGWHDVGDDRPRSIDSILGRLAGLQQADVDKLLQSMTKSNTDKLYVHAASLLGKLLLVSQDDRLKINSIFTHTFFDGGETESLRRQGYIHALEQVRSAISRCPGAVTKKYRICMCNSSLRMIHLQGEGMCAYVLILHPHPVCLVHTHGDQTIVADVR